MFKNKKAATALGWLCLFTCVSAVAEPNDYIRTPTLEFGEREIDLKMGAQRNRDGTSESATSLGYGFTPQSWWFTEFYAKYAKPPGESQGFDAWEWENKFQLTETGKYPVDMGFLLEIERPQNRTEGYELTYGPMFQTEWGKVQGNLNIFIQKHVHVKETFDSELHCQMQIKYRDSAKLEWGAQAFGNVGQWDHWSTASKREFKVGPALFGKIKAGTQEAITWNAAVLVGTSHATSNTTLRLQTEYEF